MPGPGSTLSPQPGVRLLEEKMIRTFAAAAVVGLATLAQAQPFTYQGRLEDSNLPANGSYDFELAVFPVAAGGAQVGVTTTILNQPVTSGTFTVQVDPGSDVFDGQARWLEVRVRPAGGGAYTTLAPRQELTPSPYATRALREWLMPVGPSMLMVDPARERLFLNRSGAISGAEYFGFSTPTGANAYGGMYIETQPATGKPFYGYAAAGIPRAWTYLEGASLDWRVSVGGLDRFVVTDTGNVGVGTMVPAHPLDVVGTARANAFAYASPVSHDLAIPPCAFQPRANFSDAVIESSDGTTYFVAAVGPQNLTAPVNLPDGATITGATVWFFDNSGVGDLSANFLRRGFAGNGYGTIGSGGTAGASGAVQEIALTITPQAVNNGTNTYILSIYCNNWDGILTTVKGARITYTVSSPD